MVEPLVDILVHVGCLAILVSSCLHWLLDFVAIVVQLVMGCLLVGWFGH